MVYYKIPLAGGLDYPAGCILICAYTYDGYEYCKFERVTSVGSDWVKITESEFNVRCPEFPAPTTNDYIYIDNWDDLDAFIVDVASRMTVHTEHSYSISLATVVLYGAARLRIFKGIDDGRETVRVDLYVSGCHTLHRTAYEKGADNWVWYEWEWDTPPMLSGIEYKTSERWLGKPVYTKNVDLGKLPAGYAAVAHGADATAVLRCVGVTGSGATIPYHRFEAPSYNSSVQLSADKTYIYISVDTIMNETASAQIWYTKN